VNRPDHWTVLGIAPTDDRREIRKAYTKALKELDVDSDPAAFIALREAMETATTWGKEQPWDLDDFDWELETDEVDPDSGSTEIVDSDDGGSEFHERWRAEIPPDRKTALDRHCSELDRLLFDDEESDPVRIAEAGEAILADPELHNVDRATEVEQWLAQAIIQSAPRSNSLVEPAIRRFGWRKAGKSWRREHDVDDVLARSRDLHFLATCSKPFQRHHGAVRELRGPARDRVAIRELNLTREVMDFLEVMDRDHPGLYRDFDEAKLGWWRSYFHNRHWPVDFWPAMVFVPPFLCLLAAIVAASFHRTPLLGLPFLPVAIPVTLGGLWLAGDLSARARAKAERRMYDETATGAEWIVLSSLVLPAVAALGPSDSGFAWALAASSLVLLAGAHWLGPTAAPFDLIVPKRAFLPGLAFIVWLVGAFVLAPSDVPRFAVPMGVTCWLSYWGADSVRSLLAPSRLRQAAAMLTALVPLLASAWLVADAHSTWPPIPYLAVLVPVSLVSAHLATSASLVPVPWVEYVVRLAVFLLYFVLARFFWEIGQVAVLGLCVYGLASAIVQLAVSIIYLKSVAIEMR
jgi:hypothetical protein